MFFVSPRKSVSLFRDNFRESVKDILFLVRHYFSEEESWLFYFYCVFVSCLWSLCLYCETPFCVVA